MNHLEMLKLTHIISASKAVLGEIDLDPDSNEELNSIIQAKSIFTDNTAFDVEWHGKVFVSSHFNSGRTSGYAEKLIVEYQLGNVKEAILLTESPLDSDLMFKLCDNSDAHFLSTEVDVSGRRIGKAFYFGKNIEEFGNVFSDYGKVFIESPGL